MRMPGRFKRYWNVLRLSKKPSREEFWLYTKLTLLGLGVLGAISFVIKLIINLVQLI